MNRKGFTLIELVTVIALLGIISIIAFVSIFEVIKKSKVSDCENLLLSIKSAAKEYISDNRYNVTTSGTIEYIDNKQIHVSDDQKYVLVRGSVLTNYSYLSSPITDPFDNNKNLSTGSIQLKIVLAKDYSAEDVVVKYLESGTYREVKCSDNKW